MKLEKWYPGNRLYQNTNRNIGEIGSFHAKRDNSGRPNPQYLLY